MNNYSQLERNWKSPKSLWLERNWKSEILRLLRSQIGTSWGSSAPKFWISSPNTLTHRFCEKATFFLPGPVFQWDLPGPHYTTTKTVRRVKRRDFRDFLRVEILKLSKKVARSLGHSEYVCEGVGLALITVWGTGMYVGLNWYFGWPSNTPRASPSVF